jgi:hypothetical protein
MAQDDHNAASAAPRIGEVTPEAKRGGCWRALAACRRSLQWRGCGRSAWASGGTVC